MDINKKEPILKLSLNCKYEDYEELIKMLFVKKKSTKLSIFLIILNIISITIVLFEITIFVISLLNNEIWALYEILLMFVACFLLIYISIYGWRCYKNEKIFCGFIFNKLLLKTQSFLFWGRSIKEMRKMVIPFTISFYDTYLIKTGVSVKDAKQVSAERISTLPITSTINKIEYKLLKHIKENNNCISFCIGIFIPKVHLDEIEKEKLELVKNIIFKASKAI